MTRSRRIAALLVLIGFLLLPGRTPIVQAQGAGPTLLKRTVLLNVKRFLRYWPNPKAAEPQYNTYCWVPQISFEVIGPIPAGSQFVVEFSKADGTPWFKQNLRTPEISDDEIVPVKMEMSDEFEKKAILGTGLFPFKLMLNNQLMGKNVELMAGKYKVSTYVPDQKIPEYRGKKEYYIDRDWSLPMGIMWLNPTSDAEVPHLSVEMWFRGQSESSQMEGFLFYKGKEVGKTRGNNTSSINTAGNDKNYNYSLFTFSFMTVRGFNKSSSANNYSALYFLDKNPGEYEVKVLADGKLIRTGKFNVGADGNPNDGGIAKNNKMGGIRQVFPVKVLAEPIAWNTMAWQTEALYGNPLVGFTAQ